jgi:hypothetical protein
MPEIQTSAYTSSGCTKANELESYRQRQKNITFKNAGSLFYVAYKDSRNIIRRYAIVVQAVMINI